MTDSKSEICELPSFLGYGMEHIFFQMLRFFPIYSQHFFFEQRRESWNRFTV